MTISAAAVAGRQLSLALDLALDPRLRGGDSHE
jgi:hypothetical protein